MKSAMLFGVMLAVFLGTAFGTGKPEQAVSMVSKCKCMKMTSQYVPSKENPGEIVLEKNIQILVPLRTNKNIFDPSSPLRTTFIYRYSDIWRQPEAKELQQDSPAGYKSTSAAGYSAAGYYQKKAVCPASDACYNLDTDRNLTQQ
ncbi:immunoglobulin J chain [Latimeria chalumnae]|uniref:Joining chain of multimeric IgA and IgM n=1 Tax=Latimeria chalumnae TaxID=7897 RepID=M3XLM3_LATCH|nr:PREDICTED: immunoglobulin J chain [Latimeria chalumnae]|eukprot:XP_006003786.1 PREDICTED: immunoglobulin J chain [Latimeria chalumnae]